MTIQNAQKALQFEITFELVTPLFILTGEPRDDLDNTLDVTPDGKLCVNGYAWASLFRRVFNRLKSRKKLAKTIGKYGSNTTPQVSPFWFHTSLLELPGTDVRPGIVIDRRTGAPRKGLLYVEEGAVVGLHIPMIVTVFWEFSDTQVDQLIDAFKEALWVIDQGIENIGGGWSYGFGRLKPIEARWREINISQQLNSSFLAASTIGTGEKIEIKPVSSSEISESWKRWQVKMRIVPGQLLAIHSDDPTLAESKLIWKKYPDSFVFRRLRFLPSKNDLVPEPFIPGKAIRQAIFSTHIERKIKTLNQNGDSICDPSRPKRGNRNDKSPPCNCRRCKWFGSTDQSGIIAVLDAPVENPSFEVLQRVQLCEHSLQNMNLFSEEFLTGGSWTTTIILDKGRDDGDHDELEDHIKQLLEEMTSGKAPRGWYRIGAHSTCVGPVEVVDVREN